MTTLAGPHYINLFIIHIGDSLGSQKVCSNGVLFDEMS